MHRSIIFKLRSTDEVNMKLKLRPHQIEFLDHIRKAYSEGYKSPLGVAFCGFGKTVVLAEMARLAQNRGKVTWFVVHRKELLDQTIETFKKFDIPLNLIHVVMVKTVANRIKNNKLIIAAPDFIMYDEAHFSLASTWGIITEAFPNAFILGATATPARLDGKPLKGLYDTMIQSITPQELTDKGFLAPYDYYAPSIADLSHLKKKGKDFDMKDAEDKLSGVKIYGDVIKYYHELAEGRKTIVYCQIGRASCRERVFRAV